MSYHDGGQFTIRRQWLLGRRQRQLRAAVGTPRQFGFVLAGPRLDHFFNLLGAISA